MTDTLVTRVLSKTDALLSKQAAPEPESPPASDVGARLKALQDARAEVRQLLQRTGAAFGAAATVVLAGLGYAQLHQIFPIPRSHHTWTLVAMIAGVTLAFGGAVFLAGRFFSAQRRILLTPKLGGTDIDGEDEQIQAEIYKAVAREEHAPSVEALELRARRLERLARLAKIKTEREVLEKEAKRISDAYRWAMHVSATSILERRSRDAFKGSRIFALLTAAGIVLAFGAADYAKGQRDKIALLKDCQAAIAAGADDACDTIRARDPKADETKKAAAAATAAALEGARAAFRRAGQPAARLDRLEACAHVLLATPGFKSDADQASASVVKACLTLTAAK